MQLTRETHTFHNEAAWLHARKGDVTSTEAAGLFDAGAYENSRTFYELYQIKSGTMTPTEFKGGDRAKWGNRLEAAIAAGIAEDFGVIVEPFKVYMRIPELRMGSSFDFKIIGLADGYEGDQSVRDMFKELGPGIMEVKNIDALQFKRNWIEEGETIEATPQIEFQVQHQLEVADMAWSLISPLVGGNTPKVVIRKRDTEVGALIREKTAELWQRIAAGTPPTPDYEKDAKVIAALNVFSNGTEIDLSSNNRLAELCAERKRASDEESAAKKRKDAATAEILQIIGPAAKVKAAGGFSISAGTVEEKFVEGYLRKAYRNLRVSHKAA